MWRFPVPLALKDLHPEKLFLYSLVRLYRPASVVEVGVSQGASAVAIAMALRDNDHGHLTAVDNWSRKHGGKSVSNAQALKKMFENKVEKLVTFKSSDSQEYFKEQPDNSVDIIHVDADHSREGALADIYEAIRIAKVLVVVHDSENLAGVTWACKQAQHYIYHGGHHSVEPKKHFPEGCIFVRASRGFWLAEPNA